MLNQTTEHAIRALLFLAQRPEGELVPAERIAAALGAPASYLAKTLNALAKAGVVWSTRGRMGGFRLRLAPHAVTLAAVAAAFAEARPLAICMLGDRPCNAAAPCAAHARWTAVCEETAAPLHRTTLADLLSSVPQVPVAACPVGGGRIPTASAA